MSRGGSSSARTRAVRRRGRCAVSRSFRLAGEEVVLEEALLEIAVLAIAVAILGLELVPDVSSTWTKTLAMSSFWSAFARKPSVSKWL